MLQSSVISQFLLRLTFHFPYLFSFPILPESASVADMHPIIPVFFPSSGGFSSEAASTGATDATGHTKLTKPWIQHSCASDRLSSLFLLTYLTRLRLDLAFLHLLSFYPALWSPPHFEASLLAYFNPGGRIRWVSLIKPFLPCDTIEQGLCCPFTFNHWMNASLVSHHHFCLHTLMSWVILPIPGTLISSLWRLVPLDSVLVPTQQVKLIQYCEMTLSSSSWWSSYSFSPSSIRRSLPFSTKQFNLVQ